MNRSSPGDPCEGLVPAKISLHRSLRAAGTGTYATHIPTLNLMLMPYLVDTYDQGWKRYDDSAWLKKQFDHGPAKGFRFLATWEAGFRSMTTKGPFASPEDAKGKKLRTYPNEMQRWLLEAMGFTIQIMPVTEVYLAIQQGVVWGQENPIDTIYANKFYEVAPNVTLTQHVYSPIPLSISEKTWQKLSSADRDVVTKAGREVADWIRREIRANDERQLADMTAKLASVGIGAITRALVPLFAATVLVLLLITYVPALSTTLVRLLL